MNHLHDIMDLPHQFSKIFISIGTIPGVSIRDYNYARNTNPDLEEESYQDDQDKFDSILDDANKLINNYNNSFNWVDKINNRIIGDRVNFNSSVKPKCSRARKKYLLSIGAPVPTYIQYKTNYGRLADGLHFFWIWRKNFASTIVKSMKIELEEITTNLYYKYIEDNLELVERTIHNIRFPMRKAHHKRKNFGKLKCYKARYQ